MKDLHILCGMFGHIYIAKKLKEGIMADGKIEATSEAVQAVANHLHAQKEFNDSGWAGYSFKCGEVSVRLVFFDADKYELVEKVNK